MSVVRQKMQVEQLERRDCPTVPGAGLPVAIQQEDNILSTALAKLDGDFYAKAPPTTISIDVLTVMGDTAKLAADVRAATNASYGAMIPPLVSLELDEATFYFDIVTGNTAGARTAAMNELNDLDRLATALAGTTNPGLAATAFAQAYFSFNITNNHLLGLVGG
jgi:hypothetical protein